jgi:hypothetical protein
MKKYVRFLIFMLLAASVVSCSKEKSIETGNGGGSAVTGVLKMKIDGVQWVANKGAGATIVGGLIAIQGISNDDRFFNITLQDDGPVTYQLDNQALNVAVLTDANSPTGGVGYTTNQGNTGDAGGTLVITKIDETNKTISGTFSFKMFRESDSKQVVITEGSFENLKYTTELPPNTGADADFKVKIDGTLWSGQVVSGAAFNNQLIISAAETNVSKSVGLTMPDNVTPGTYSFSQFGTYMAIYNYGSATSPTTLVSESGSLTITEHNTSTKTIKGTFSFVGRQITGGTAVQFTEGSFTVKYL